MQKLHIHRLFFVIWKMTEERGGLLHITYDYFWLHYYLHYSHIVYSLSRQTVSAIQLSNGTVTLFTLYNAQQVWNRDTNYTVQFTETTFISIIVFVNLLSLKIIFCILQDTNMFLPNLMLIIFTFRKVLLALKKGPIFNDSLIN